MNINPTATEGVKAPEVQPYKPPEIEGDNIDLRSDQIVREVDEATLAKINSALTSRSIQFQIEDDGVVMQIVDTVSEEVIKEIPDKHINDTVNRMREAIQSGKNVGVLVDEMV